MKYIILCSIEDFYKLEKEWAELEKTTLNSNISSSFIWIKTWWDIYNSTENNKFGYTKQLKIIVGYDNEKLKIIAPLLLLRRKVGFLSISFLEFIGQQWGATTLDLIIDKNIKFNYFEFVNFCRKNINFNVFYLRQIPYETQTYKDKLNIYSGCPIINIQNFQNFNEYKKIIYSKNLKQNLRTAINKLKRGNINLSTTTDEIIDESLFKQIIYISKSKLVDNKKCLYDFSQNESFYKKISTLFNGQIIMIYLNGVPVCYRLNIIYNNMKFCIDASYDRRYKIYDLGKLSVEENIVDSFKRNIRVHNCGPGLDSYKLKFNESILRLGYLVEKGNGFFSFIYYFFFKKYLMRKY